MKRPLIAIAALATLATSAPAFAGTAAVSYKDLNLSTIEGQEVLERRIDIAAKKVCGYDDLRTGTRMPSADAKRCYQEATNKARASFAAVVEEHQLGG